MGHLIQMIQKYPREMILPNGVTREELNQISIQNMKTSENVAIAVALEYLDFNVSTKGEGVLVVGVLEGSPVEGKLKKGDKIFSINNKEISSASEFIATLREFEIGEFIKIGLYREFDGDEQFLEIETKLIEHVDYEDEPMVGFLATTINEKFDFPFLIDIKTGNVGGPSAGLMMALNVYNNLIPEDITNSMVIAGTGTIEVDGSVGPVGGIKQKLFLQRTLRAYLSIKNFEEAKPLATDFTKIVAVESFEEALKVISKYSSR